jgi:hypothetical protein
VTDPNRTPPPGVPPEVARYLEEAAQRLSDVIEEFKLDLKPYEHHTPGRVLWCHSLYSTYMGRRICVRILIEKTLAQVLVVRIVSYLRNYASLEINDWMTYESRPVKGLDYLVSVVRKMTIELKELCELMPYPTRPDAKA